MAYKMTKRGSLDNEPANEFICDTSADLAKIDQALINLGSIALIIDGMEIYIASSDKTWHSISGAQE